MSSSAGSNRPIIIKRKKVVSHGGHHGGAWKVAYADFVTAMMAFFLLMWLLNATTEDQRIALATYFTPTISISNGAGGGNGALGGDSVFSEETLAQMGTGATAERAAQENAARGDTGSAPQENRMAGTDEAALADTLERALMASGGESNLANDLMRHIHTRVSDEGVVIDITGLRDTQLFEPGSTAPSPRLALLLDLVATILPVVRNDVAISAFRQDGPMPASGTARADAVAAELTRSGLGSSRIVRVSGLAPQGTSDIVSGIRRDDRVIVTILRN